MPAACQRAAGLLPPPSSVGVPREGLRGRANPSNLTRLAPAEETETWHARPAVSRTPRPVKGPAMHDAMPPALLIDGTARIGGVPLFGPLRLMAEAGRITCLLGPSGVGKTTLLRLVAGTDEVTRFEGHIKASDGAPLAGRVALMAQGADLLPWLDVTGNVTLGARLRGTRADMARARDILARTGLSDHARKRPHALSGGQRQRAALARTLMEDRPLVLLDEPFSALDAGTRAQMQELGAQHLAGRTVLMVTHDPGEAARMGHAIHILGADGIETVAPPAAPVPRPVDDAETLEVQGRLLARLRAQGAAA